MSDRRDDMMTDIGQDARVLKAARRLPVTKLAQEDIAGVRAHYIRYSSGVGITDSDAAKQIGVSSTVISQFRNDCYPGDNEKLARKVNDWIEQHARRQAAALPANYVTTQIAQDFDAIISLANSLVRIAVIVAPSGCGKTMALHALSDKFRATYFYCTPDMTPTQFLRAVAATIGCSKSTRVSAQVMQDIVTRLKGSNRPLFLDEAHLLPANTLTRVRAIHDQAQIPIVLAGTHDILRRVDDRHDGLGQFARRCLLYNAMEHFVNADNPDPGPAPGTTSRRSKSRAMFTRDEVRRFLDGLQVKLDVDAFEMVWSIACLPNHGTLGTVASIVQFLRRDKASRSKPITAKEVRYALKFLLGEVGESVYRSAALHRKVMASSA